MYLGVTMNEWMRLTTGGQPVGREGVERNGAEGERAGQGRDGASPAQAGSWAGGQAGRLGYATLGQDVGGRTGRGTGRGGHPVGRLKRGKGGEGRSFLPLLCCCLTRRIAGSSLSLLCSRLESARSGP
jgi:hypothetical protein